jgi:hypothetical protein
MSLSQMINCSLIGLSGLSGQLMFYETLFRDHSLSTEELSHPIDPIVGKQIAGWLKIAANVAVEFELKAVGGRVDILQKKMSKQPISYSDMGIEMRVLRETLQSEVTGHSIYRYPNEKGEVLQRWKTDWASVIAAFPSSQSDVIAGVDLWALGHSTASVFHFMRVLEHGLRALAADVEKTFDVQQWQNIIDEIESEIRRLGKALPRGIEKNERLKFLSEAAKEFVYFKDGWRNYVSHNRGVYDEHQARSVLEHVRAFMAVLSSKLSE